MAQLSLQDLGAHLQAYLNHVELCKALKKQTSDPQVRESLDMLIHGGQESLATLASHMRRMGAAPGVHELDRAGRARMREVLALRSLGDQLFAVRRSLADLVAWYQAHAAADHADPASHDLLASLSAQAHRMLEGWDRHIEEMRAPSSPGSRFSPNE
jgi:hypothetical protein